MLEDGGSEEDEGGTEGGDGFSVEDLTDLEDEASNCSPAGDDCPVVTGTCTYVHVSELFDEGCSGLGCTYTYVIRSHVLMAPL